MSTERKKTMTVGELRAELAKWPDDLQVAIPPDSCGCCFPDHPQPAIQLVNEVVVRNANEWKRERDYYYGPTDTKKGRAKVVLISTFSKLDTYHDGFVSTDAESD